TGDTNAADGTLRLAADHVSRDMHIAMGATLQLDDAVTANVASLNGAGAVRLRSDAMFAIAGPGASLLSGAINGDGNVALGGNLTLTGDSAIGGTLMVGCGCGDPPSLTVDGGRMAAEQIGLVDGVIDVQGGGRMTTSALEIMTGRLNITGGGVVEGGSDAFVVGTAGDAFVSVSGAGSRISIDGDALLGFGG